MLEDIGDGLSTDCGRCGKSVTLQQQFEHRGVVICHICATECAGELQSESAWAQAITLTSRGSAAKAPFSVRSREYHRRRITVERLIPGDGIMLHSGCLHSPTLT